MSIVKLNNRGIRSATAVGTTTALGSIIFIKKLTASSDATLSFVDGSSSVVLDNTYKEYLFTFNNMHPATDNANLVFNGSDDTSSHSYDVTKTTTLFRSFHYENGSSAGIGYRDTQDLAQATGFQDLTDSIGNDNDTAACGFLHLFNPSSTTFVKHFIAQTILPYQDELSWHGFISGYFNTTSAITAIQFKMDSGNIDAGDICLYGIN
jgi:hypothetical protein|tara:strand:+ start:21 stop:644 length:624 start_codon:yes stop_codon:yes gene_type:complete